MDLASGGELSFQLEAPLDAADHAPSSSPSLSSAATMGVAGVRGVAAEEDEGASSNHGGGGDPLAPLAPLAPRIPVGVSEAHHSEVHDTVAEMMILANATVARRIHEAYPSASLVRRHAAPRQVRLRGTRRRWMAKGRGFNQTRGSAFSLHECLWVRLDWIILDYPKLALRVAYVWPI